jgi:hypothetical protein
MLNAFTTFASTHVLYPVLSFRYERILRHSGIPRSIFFTQRAHWAPKRATYCCCYSRRDGRKVRRKSYQSDEARKGKERKRKRMPI